MGQFFLVYGCRRRKTRENVSSHCVIKFISTKNAKVLDTGRKFVVLKYKAAKHVCFTMPYFKNVFP